ncbi:MAG: DUF305 domain-containing protein [Actinomycetes bacterium]
MTATGLPPSPPDADEGAPSTDEYEPAGWTTSSLFVAAALAAMLAVAATLIIRHVVTTPSADSVDVGFLQDMTTHHSQAIELAAIGAENATDPEVRSFAREVLIFQQQEVGYMDAILEGWGQSSGDPERSAMTWMGMPTPLADMPGMQPDSVVAGARTLTGAAADATYLRTMIAHHRGGVHMAEFAARRARDPRVRSLAERMRTQQQGEIADYQRAAKRLGITL